MLYKTKYIGYYVDEIGNVWTTKIKGGQGKLGEPRVHCYKIDRYGYKVVCLSNGKERKYETIHRLVYESIKGDIPEGYHVDHIDTNKLNNNIENLQLLTIKENVRKARCGVSPWQKGKKHTCRNIYSFYISDEYVGDFDQKELIELYGLTRHDFEAKHKTQRLLKKGYTLIRV